MDKPKNRGSNAVGKFPESGDMKDAAIPGSVNILVIDDEKIIRELFHEILVPEGYNITLSDCGLDGMKAFNEGDYDIVFTDLGLPEISGWEVASAIKRKEPSTVVVMITGWGLQLDDAELRNSGVDFLLPKPFRIQEIKDSVTQAIQTRSKRHIDAGDVLC